MSELIKRMIGRPSRFALKRSACFLLSFSLCIPSWASCLCDCSTQELHESESTCCKSYSCSISHHTAGQRHKSYSEHHHHGYKHHHHHHKHSHDCDCHKCPTCSPTESRTIEIPPIDPIECYRFCESTQACENRESRRPLPTDWQSNSRPTNSVSLQVLLCVWTN